MRPPHQLIYCSILYIQYKGSITVRLHDIEGCLLSKAPWTLTFESPSGITKSLWFVPCSLTHVNIS